MSKPTFLLKAPIPVDPTRPNSGTQWARIGRATRLDDERIICTMESIPLNWNGVFYIFENTEK